MFVSALTSSARIPLTYELCTQDLFFGIKNYFFGINYITVSSHIVSTQQNKLILILSQTESTANTSKSIITTPKNKTTFTRTFVYLVNCRTCQSARRLEVIWILHLEMDVLVFQYRSCFDFDYTRFVLRRAFAHMLPLRAFIYFISIFVFDKMQQTENGGKEVKKNRQTHGIDIDV